MKYRSLIKDTFREISRTKTRFISIFAIILIGVAFFAGLSATGPVMVMTADDYFTDLQLSDAHIFSTMGLEDGDIDLLETMDQTEVKATYSQDVIFAETALSSKVYALHGDDQSMDRPALVEGRLPEASDEILLDHTTAYLEEYTIGDTVMIETGTPDAFEDAFHYTAFEVVGFINHPRYIERGQRGSTQVGTGTLNGFSMVPQEAFNLDVYTDAFLSFENARNFASFSPEYEAYIMQRLDEAEGLLADRPSERFDALVTEIDLEIQEGYDEIEEARQALLDAEEELEQARAELDTGQAEYETGLIELETQERDARQQINSQRSELLAAQTEVEGAIGQLEAAGADDPQASAELNAQRNQIQSALSQLETAEAELDQEIAEGQRALEAARAELEEAETEYEQGRAEFEQEQAEAEAEIEAAEADLTEAELDLADLEEPDYFFEDRTAFQGYEEFEDNAERIGAIAQIFPVFFFLLAALISLTTMTRMVDEERNQIGTLKALGYGNLVIAMKYFVYAFLATVSGAVTGLFLGYWLFPRVVMDAYSSLYNLPQAQTQFFWSYAIISLVGALLATGLSTLISVRLSLRSNPSILLLPKAPKKGKRIFLEYMPFIWNRFTFTQKVASRNLFRYKRRMLMTLFGVAGGTALLLTGYGLSDSIADIGDIQFGEINLYQAIVSENPNASEEQFARYEETLQETEGLEGELPVRLENGTATASDSDQDINVMSPSDESRIGEFVALRSLSYPDEIIELPAEGAVITDKLAELLGSEQGDTITVEVNDLDAFEVEVSAVVEHYVQHYVYLSPEAFEAAVGESAEPNSRLLRYDTELVDEDQLGQELTGEEAVQGVIFAASIRSAFQDSMDSLDVVTVVLIFSAASLAFVVLYNLTNINVSERIRELSTIKVLGFFDREVTLYVYRENFVLTIMGILAGFLLGYIMHGFVLQTAEIDIMRFARQISISSYIYAFLLMFFFSSLVMVVMHFKLKRVDMVEALKTQD
ncbi:ABC transporter, permease protein [Alkalibacterium sp. AK22]|uniref:ABC transporter permease n=1 Tax=Alkalibacterium sp. AK22 TaxID=1229520 RepID=UPI000446424E|nr:ABC transporter permease [Alkalibacterium sp. AK22]EXJ23003.1 ABC transporter, permease protein [Alkalibacterium sp. AK22]